MVDLVHACHNNYFPELSVLTEFGIDGFGGTSPVDVLKCYQLAILHGGVTAEQLEDHSDLNVLILDNHKVVDSNEGIRVRGSGGIQLSTSQPWEECPICNNCSINYCGCELRIMPKLFSRSLPT